MNLENKPTWTISEQCNMSKSWIKNDTNFIFFSWYNTEIFISLLCLSMHCIWEKQFHASVRNFLRFGLLETSKTFYMEFLMLRDSKHTWFLFSGSTCLNQKSKGKETLNFKKSKWIQVEGNSTLWSPSISLPHSQSLFTTWKNS